MTLARAKRTLPSRRNLKASRPAAGVLFINSRVREETGVVCFLDPVLTQLQGFICHSFISGRGTRKILRRSNPIPAKHLMFVFIYNHNNYLKASQAHGPCFLASRGSRRFVICHSLISSCLWILPLLLSRKDTWVSLYWVMTSTNFLDNTVCWGHKDRGHFRLQGFRI